MLGILTIVSSNSGYGYDKPSNWNSFPIRGSVFVIWNIVSCHKLEKGYEGASLDLVFMLPKRIFYRHSGYVAF